MTEFHALARHPLQYKMHISILNLLSLSILIRQIEVYKTFLQSVPFDASFK